MPSLTDTFKALADPTRRKIIQLLRHQDMAAEEIAEHFTITKPSLSHHLNILKQADLVIDQRQGQNIIYSLNLTVFQEVMGWCMEMLNVDKEENENE